MVHDCQPDHGRGAAPGVRIAPVIRPLLVAAAAGLLPIDSQGGEVVRCRDGSYREAPCSPLDLGPAAVPLRGGILCDPAHPAYMQCRRALAGLAAEPARDTAAEEEQRRKAAAAEAKRRLQEQRLTGTCDFLFTPAEREDCRRQEKARHAHERHLPRRTPAAQ